ncbi:MAG: SGNH/GDSL hydrolase family protein [Clostridia bacterium]|nr:SGNH/GDSL hydrolase family protein [Clostridia bacterium]
MKDFQENIIPAYGQNPNNVYLFDNEKSKVRILFVGNSITKHAPKPEVGWNNNCGMAASSIDKDYVHLIVKWISEKYDKNLAFGIAQVANYARTFFDKGPEETYYEARDFSPNIVIMFYGANVSKDYDLMENPPKKFGAAYEELRNYLDNGNVKFFHSEGFYIRPVLDAEKKAIAEKYNEPFITMEGIRDIPETHGKFNHPGDFGMEQIAKRFFEHIEPTLIELTNK